MVESVAWEYAAKGLFIYVAMICIAGIALTIVEKAYMSKRKGYPYPAGTQILKIYNDKEGRE